MTIKLRQLLEALGQRKPEPDLMRSVALVELAQPAPMPIRPQRPPSKSRNYPRSVCTTLKDLCEL